MSDLSCIQALDAARADIAAKVAAWEAENGPVQTLPIRVGNAPVETFSINVPGKPKNMPSSSQALRAMDHARVTQRTAKKLEKVARIRELASTGMKIEEIAENSGLTPRYVMKAISEHGIARGRKASMESA